MPSVISGDANVSATEFGFLDGVTSGLQSQINAKANDSAVGLVKITDSTFSSVSSVSVNNCFTSTYRDYRLLIDCVNTTSEPLRIRMRANGVDDASNNYNLQTLNGSTTTANAGNATATFADIGSAITARGVHSFDVFFPQVATQTQMVGMWMNFLSANPFVSIRAAAHNVASSFDGFTLIAATGNMTGTVRVYGYRN